MSANNAKNVVNNQNNKLLTVLNNIVTTSPLAASYGLGNYLPVTYTAPLFFATNTQVLKRNVSNVNYIEFTYKFYLLDGIGNSTSLTNLSTLVDLIDTSYSGYLDFYSFDDSTITTTILPSKGASISGIVITYDLDAMNLPEDSCCNLILVEGPIGDSGSSGTAGSSGSSGINGSSGSSGANGIAGSSGTNGAAGSSGTAGSAGSSGFDGAAGDSAGLTLYVNPSNTQVTFYEISGTPLVNPETTIVDTLNHLVNVDPTSAKVIGSFLTPSGTPNASVIAPGRWIFFTYIDSVASSPSTSNNVYIGYKIYKYNAGITNLLKESIFKLITPGGGNDQTSTAFVMPATSIDVTDRIFIEFLAYTDGDADKTVTIYSEGEDRYSFVTTSLNFVSGTSGSSGANGVAGSSGVDGTNGSSGSSGANGASGTNGSSGSSGTNGAVGGAGTSGSSGANGSSGSSGANGVSGSSGSSGANGVSGSSGSSGANGSSGSSGANGVSGSAGSSGIGITGASFGITVDGIGGVPSTGSKGYIYVPYAATITSWSIMGNTSGSAVLDIKRSSTSIIGGGNKPTLSAAQFSNAAVSGWTSTSIASGDTLEFNLDSCSTISRINLVVVLTRI